MSECVFMRACRCVRVMKGWGGGGGLDIRGKGERDFRSSPSMYPCEEWPEGEARKLWLGAYDVVTLTSFLIWTFF